MQDKRKFDKVLLSFKQQGLIDSDSFYGESEEGIKNLKEALQELKTMDISEESKLSLENVKRLIQRNFSENPLAWWDRNKIEATLKIKEECKYDSPGFLVRNHGEIKRGKPREGLVLSEKKATIAVSKIEFLGILIDETGIELQEHIVEKIRNFPDILKDKKHLQSFLGVVNFAGIFIKDLAKYRKDFRPLLKETESAKWKWEEIHTQRVRELKQLAITCQSLQYHKTRMNWKSTEFAEASVREKREDAHMENKLPATEVTRMKTCNMLHVLGNGITMYALACEKQEKPLFGTKIRVTQKKPEPKPTRVKGKNFYKEK
ncbi:UNVERIFIED_CONTAM: putative enzymatic polyprotein [Sesamum calycinum]|uniref:Enzymatic polyprotein n=1 Tax=Sesamum calycinum TaxID=2727403 RepID=A0AAW2KX16_9LAMI